MTTLSTTGHLAVDGHNLFALLKESLYGEDDIVMRELVSNGCDAIVKRVARGDEFTGVVQVSVDPDLGIISVADNGVGMTHQEVDRFINQIALSGTAEFVRDAGSTEAVGHFGVGFYSAFMLGDVVQIDTCSAAGAAPVRWVGKADMSWRIEAGDRAQVGTTVTIHLDPSSAWRDPELARAALEKYFPFPLVPIQLRTPAGVREIGQTSPAWRRPGGTVTGGELTDFYRGYFDEDTDPLAWVRIESPDLGLRGMVFIRDTHGGDAAIDGRVDVIVRGVWLGRDLPGLIPKFANLQHAVLECDRLDLVLSRADARDGQVTPLVAECLSQELAIAMYQLFTTNRERYEKLWPELAPFMKYGVLTDRIFASVMTNRLLYPTLDGALVTLQEYQAQLPEQLAGQVFYTSDPVAQAGFIRAFRDAGVPAVVLDHVIDQPLLQRLELANQHVTFTRLDADAVTVLVAGQPDEQPDSAALAGIFEGIAARLPGVAVHLAQLATPELSVVLTAPEAPRRVAELRRLGGLTLGLDHETVLPRTLLVNLASPTIAALAAAPPKLAMTAAEHLVDLALLTQDELRPEDLLGFIARSENLLAEHLRQASPTTKETTHHD